MKVLMVDNNLPHKDMEKAIIGKFATVEEAKSTLEDALVGEVKDIDIMLVIPANIPITKRIMEAGIKLKAVIRYGIGVNNIDVSAATEKGIMVINVPDYCISEVSDHTIALTLSLIRKITQSVESTKNGEWKSTNFTASFRLEGKILGIIGFGKIGRSVAYKMRSLGLEILVYDPFIDKNLIKKLDVKKVSLEELLQKSDIITLHCPLTSETKKIISEETLRLMKKMAYLVNTARGGLMDETAIYRALNEGRIAGVALDVLDEEPPNPDNPLLKLSNVIVTPHIAWSSPEAIWQLENSVVEETTRILKGEKPKNVVNARDLKIE
jgi:D-3-phosphoglycerate dehydrogenase